MPGKWSHSGHKTWLDCSKTIPKARPLHKELLRATNRKERTAKAVLQFWPHSHSRKPAWYSGSLEGGGGGAEVQGGSHRHGSCPTASALERTVSSVLSQSHCLLFLTHRMTEQQSAFPLPILKPWAQLLLHPPKRWVAVFRSSPASYTVLKLLLICWGLNTPWQSSVEIHSWFLSAMSVLRKCPSLVN